jgi:hypothetical protein
MLTYLDSTRSEVPCRVEGTIEAVASIGRWTLTFTSGTIRAIGTQLISCVKKEYQSKYSRDKIGGVGAEIRR